MISKIHDLTNILREVRGNFQAAFIDAEETKKKELETLKNSYIPNTELYEKKKKQIEIDFDIAVVKARAAAANKAGEAIEDLREWEIQGVQRIDTEALAKINAIRDIPVTANELKMILKKFLISNYWVQRSIASIAEQNGIPQTDLNLDAPLDVKLNMLDRLSNQLEDMLEHFTMDPNKSDRKSMEARWLYLNDDILQNVIDIYTNNLRNVSEMDAATQAFYRIKATSGQMQKGVAIANAMRNLKKEDTKNILLYRLSQETGISNVAYEIAGISSEMAEWKHGKNERYMKARKMMEKLKAETETEKIKNTLRNYMTRVDKGIEQENEFLSKEITKTYKRNSSIGKALQEMSLAERTTLMSGEIEPEQIDNAAE